MVTPAKSLAKLPPHVREPNPDIYWSDNYVTVDFETTTEHKGTPLYEGNRIILACWKEGKTGQTRHTFGSEYEQGTLVAAVENADFLVAHNAKFELGWLRRCGVDLRKVIVYDTIIGEYILGGNRFNMRMIGLAKCLKRYGLKPKMDLIGMMFDHGIDTENIPRSWLLKYCEWDVEGCEQLFLKQRENLKNKGLIHLQYQRCLLTPALADIEAHGMQLDAKKVDEMAKLKEEEYARQTAELQEFMEGASPTSSEQKAIYVYDTLGFEAPRDHKGKPILTPGGKPSVAAPVLEKLKATNKKQEEFLERYNKWAVLNSDVTKYLRKFKACCDESGGRLQAIFNQCIAKTHRLTSSGLWHKVQFQNLNRAFKPMFCSRNEGWLVGEADGAQLEFRIATHLGRDRVALSDILDPDFDAHVRSGAAMAQRDYTELLEKVRNRDKEANTIRQDAKPDTFKPLYGGKSGTERQRRWYKEFQDRYKYISKTQYEWTQDVLRDKYLVTEYGMRFYWSDCSMSQSGYISYTPSIYNYPVQGFATAEIIPIALVCAWHRMKDMESFLVNTVHDSIIAELHPEEVDLWHDLAKQSLIKDCYDILTKLYGISLTVPLGAGVLVGSHWNDSTAKESEVTYNADPELYEDAARKEGMLNE